jgi:hypothetical protein
MAVTRCRRGHNAPRSQALISELQKVLAVTKCIRLAAEYGEDDSLDIADALGGLLILIEAAAVLLDQPEVAP